MMTDPGVAVASLATIETADKGLVVVGLSRSGTSMVAACLRAGGVFFGDTFPPTKASPGGNLEHVWLKDHPNASAAEFFARLAEEGRWDRPWGVKGGTRVWQWARRLKPDVAVFCWRGPEDIRASRRRVGWEDPGLERVQEAQVNLLRLVELDGGPLVHVVYTPRLAAGRVDVLDEPLRLVGLSADHNAMRDCIIPGAFRE